MHISCLLVSVIHRSDGAWQGLCSETLWAELEVLVVPILIWGTGLPASQIDCWPNSLLCIRKLFLLPVGCWLDAPPQHLQDAFSYLTPAGMSQHRVRPFA